MYAGSLVPQQRLIDCDTHDSVDDLDRIRLDRLVGGQRQRTTGRKLEGRPVARADDGAAILVPLALAQRPVVVRAAILDGVEPAAAVVDADEGARRDGDKLDRAGRELVGG